MSMLPIMNIENLTQRDLDLLTSHYRHWWIIDDSMECVGWKNGKPLFRPVKEVTDVAAA